MTQTPHTTPLGAPTDRSLGGKADGLADLLRAGFDVPAGFVVHHDWFAAVLRANEADDRLGRLLAHLHESTAEAVARDVEAMLRHLHVPDDLRSSLVTQAEQLGVHALAVRSSAAREDLAGMSFAGQYETVLGVAPHDVPHAALRCFRSAYSPAVLGYLAHHGLPADGEIHVLVQQLVPATTAGVAFTVNPITGADTEIVVEVVEGLGDRLVAGHVRAERFVHDWWNAETRERTPMLSAAHESALVRLALDVQRHHGQPCDLEFAFEGERLHLLQARPITRVHHSGIDDQWTTADFKDGGVSSAVCSPYMWSLYEFIWEHWLRKFFLDSALLQPDDLRQLGRMFYGRPYWNLSVVKAAMAKAPGYTERQFDSELGVRITYDGPGTTTGFTPASLLAVGRVALKQRTIVAQQRDTVAQHHRDLIAIAQQIETRLAMPLTGADAASLWRELVFTHYHRSEGTYFWQIFINTIHQQLAKDALTKVVGEQGFFHLISGLPQVSHLRPFHDAWTISRTIHADSAALEWWTSTPTVEITEALDRGDDRHHLDQVRRLVAQYGYHSVRELDVTHPDFDEDHLAVVTMVADTVSLDDTYSPDHDRARLHARYSRTLTEAEDTLGPRKAAKFRQRVERTREMLWWREELRDVSTRFYHLIRRATLVLGEHLVANGSLSRVDDIWFTRISEIADHLDGRLSPDDLQRLVARHRTYYDSFAQYTPPNELGRTFDAPATTDVAADGALVGLGASPGHVTGVARVVSGLDEIDRIRPGDILVTKFTDTGWTGKFALVKGVVTEYGGLLCHASIVSREYGIPCVVALHDAMAHIPDGATITVDGSAGSVVVHGGESS